MSDKRLLLMCQVAGDDVESSFEAASSFSARRSRQGASCDPIGGTMKERGCSRS